MKKIINFYILLLMSGLMFSAAERHDTSFKELDRSTVNQSSPKTVVGAFSQRTNTNNDKIRLPSCDEKLNKEVCCSVANGNFPLFRGLLKAVGGKRRFYTVNDSGSIVVGLAYLLSSPDGNEEIAKRMAELALKRGYALDDSRAADYESPLRLFIHNHNINPLLVNSKGLQEMEKMIEAARYS